MAALTLHDAPPTVRRAVDGALLADVLVAGRDLAGVLAQAWSAVTRAAGEQWPAFAEECFERACELMEIAAQHRSAPAKSAVASATADVRSGR